MIWLGIMKLWPKITNERDSWAHAYFHFHRRFYLESSGTFFCRLIRNSTTGSIPLFMETLSYFQCFAILKSAAIIFLIIWLYHDLIIHSLLMYTCIVSARGYYKSWCCEHSCRTLLGSYIFFFLGKYLRVDVLVKS